MKYVALLRGINVGGKNKLPMKDLAGMFTGAGCTDVRTFIQSGNVVFSASAATASGIASTIAKTIEDGFGFRCPVVLRSAKEMDRAIAKPPFPAECLHLMFLKDAPSGVKDLDPERSSPDQFVVHGREIYLYLPNGVARSKLTNAYFDQKLGTVSTIRNWRTVLAIREMMG